MAGTILVVDDSEADVKPLLLAFAQVRIENPVHVCHDGEAALEYLASTDFVRPLPRLILLGTNLSGMSGFDVLTRIKEHPTWRHITTIMFCASSTRKEDAKRADQLGADGFLTKPKTVKELRAMVQSFPAKWMGK